MKTPKPPAGTKGAASYADQTTPGGHARSRAQQFARQRGLPAASVPAPPATTPAAAPSKASPKRRGKA